MKSLTLAPLCRKVARKDWASADAPLPIQPLGGTLGSPLTAVGLVKWLDAAALEEGLCLYTESWHFSKSEARQVIPFSLASGAGGVASVPSRNHSQLGGCAAALPAGPPCSPTRIRHRPGASRQYRQAHPEGQDRLQDHGWARGP